MASGNRIKRLREQSRMLPVHLAAELNVPERRVLRWEKGESGIPDHFKLELARIFDVTVAHVMGWPEPNGDGDNDGHTAEAEEAA